MTLEASPSTVLCRLDEIGDPGSRAFTVTLASVSREIFVVRQGTQAFAYINSCPHTGMPLDWVPDQFLDLEQSYIQCANHAALFHIESGLCIAGPCTGQHLTAVRLEVESGEVVLLEGAASRGMADR